MAGRSRATTTLVVLLLTVAVLVGAVVYNDAAAPPPETRYSAETAHLFAAPRASAGPTLPLGGGKVAIGAHHLLDAQAGRFVPTDGGASFAAESEGVVDPTANGDVFAWIEPRSSPVIHVRDFARGTGAAVEVPQGLQPAPGTLRVGNRLVVWSYQDAQGASQQAGMRWADPTPSTFDIQLTGTPALGATVDDLVFAVVPGTASLLVVLNTTSQERLTLAEGTGAFGLQPGRGFVAWMNETASRVDYFDLAAQRVNALPTPLGVRPIWVRASGPTILVGGLEGGLLGDSPRSWLYEFSTGEAALYEDVSVPVDSAAAFALADHTLVAVVAKEQPRAQAPYTLALLGVAVAGMLGTAYLGLRDALQGQDDRES